MSTETPIQEALRLANADKASILRRIETEIKILETAPFSGEINSILKAGALGMLHRLKDVFLEAEWIDPREVHD